MPSSSRKLVPKQTWIVIDVPCLAWRSFYSIGDLSYDGVATGILYSVLHDISSLTDRFGTDRIAFCFDNGRPLRCDIYPEYKASRQKKAEQNPELAKAKGSVQQQLKMLETDYLPAIGFNNVFSQKGFEADDQVAAVVYQLTHDGHRAIVVGSDHDLLQLIDYKVRVWNPVKSLLITKKIFRRQYGIGPAQWSLVKSVAGCATDGIKGIEGVGEKTAIKWIQGILDVNSKARYAIVQGTDIIERNWKLVHLPFAGVQKIELQEDSVTRSKIEAVTKRLGIKMRSLGKWKWMA